MIYMAVWVTSDSHFNHENVIKYCSKSRPFETVKEMNETLIERWNSCVKSEDTVIHCGDFFMGQVKEIDEILQRLNGKIILVRGNHDTQSRIEKYKEYGIEIKDIHYLKYKKKLFLCTHYPMIVINGDRDRYIFNIHGHTHQFSFLSEYPKCIHVGVDSNNLTPINLDYIWRLSEDEQVRKKIPSETPEDMESDR